MKTSPNLRRTAHPNLGRVGLRQILLLGVAAVAASLAVVLGSTLHGPQPQVEFLQVALGEHREAASLERHPRAGTVVRLKPGGYRVHSAGITVGLRAEDTGREELQRFEHGVARRTQYGWEAVTVSARRTEQFLTVRKRQGSKRWRWELQTADLTPRVGDDGAVAFIRDGRLLSELWLAPPRVLDEDRRDITPDGAHWALEQVGEGWSLALDLDDSELPLPYVIDPAIVARTPASSANTGAGANTITITKPTGLVAGDLMLAQITTRGGTSVAVCPPTATGTWTSVDRRDSTTTLGQEILRLSATAADVAAASYAFQLRATNCAGALSSQQASGGIVAYVDTANQANPIDVPNGAAFASASTVTPPAVTPTVNNTRVATFYAAASGGTVGSNWSGVTGELWDQSSTGVGATTRTTSAAGNAAGTAAGVAFTPSTGDFVSTNAVNIGQTLALAPLAPDGSGTLPAGTTNVAASSTGNTIVFTYTVATGGMRNGSLTLVVPAGWSAPSTTGAAAGYTTSSSGAVGVAGQTITVSGLTLTAGSTVTVTYGSTAGGGAGATATATTGAQTWQAQQRSSSLSGALTNLATSPSITVNAANGSGTLSASPTAAAASSGGNTLTFTYTAAAGGMSDGAVRVTVPAGWSAPSTTGTAAGYTTASTGTVGVAGQVITVTGATLAGSATMTIVYGSTAGSGPGATATGSTGSQTWQGAQRSVTAGTITNLAASPSVTVNAADGSGTLTTPTTVVANGSSGNTLTFTYTAAAGGMTNGAVRVTVPTGWSAPSTTGTAAGYTTASAGTVGAVGQVITVTGVTLAGSATMTIAYGSTAGSGPGATAASTAGPQSWQGAQRSVSASTIANLAVSPSVTILAADGTGTLAPSPTSAVAGSTGNTITLTYTAAATGGMSAGAVRVTLPAGWSPPSTTGTAAGYTTASTGTVGVAGQVVTVTGVTLAAGGTLTVVYGSTAGSGPGATAATSTGAGATWQSEQRSSSGGTLTNLSSSPSVTISHAALDNFLVEAAGGGAIGPQTVGVAFSVRATARDVYGNTVTAFDGGANTVDVTSSGTMTAGGGATATFSNGVLASHSVTLGSTGATTITTTRTSGGSQSGTSASFTMNPGTMTNTSPVSITGAVKVGESLSRSSASWTPGPDSRAYQWRRCDNTGANCSDIVGATTTDYSLVAADLGQTIRVVETASKTAYNDATSTSSQTAIVATGDFTNTSPVSITGTVKVGEILTRSAATWNPGPDSRTYQWRRCDNAGANCADIAGETGNSYTLAAADLAQTIRVVETASKTAYNDAGSTSAQTAGVAAGDFVDTDPVSITGTAKVGELLTRSAASWTPGPDSRAYQWRRCDNAGASCADIAGATGNSYTLAAADLAQTIRVVETAAKTAYNDATSTSTQTAAVATGDFTNVAPVSITGTVKVGEALTRSAASWTPGPDSRSFQWRRCDSAGASCADLAGETGTSYTLVPADLGQTIRVVEVASKTAYNDASSTSAQTAAVALGDLANTSPVSITGSVKVGEVLTRSTAGWNPAPDSRTYQWRRCDSAGASCSNLAGETGTSYTLVAADLGQTIRVVETAAKTAYNDATSTSTQTAAVALGDFTNITPVSIAGIAAVGRTLTRSSAAWNPAPDSRTYQWRRCDNTGANCSNLAGETGTSYTLVAADLGQTIRLIESVGKTAYNNASSTSAQTAVIAPGTFTNTAPASITGIAAVGQTLNRSTAGWNPAPDSRTYQWRRCDSAGANCADIGGATNTDYTPVAADLGQTIRVVETASKTAYNEATSTSAQTAVVAAGTLTNTGPVSITGTVKVGEVLSRSAASWTPGPDTRSYRWRRCDSAGANCADIGGATNTDYTPVAADLGQTIRVVETASKTAYNDATSTSAQTAAVAAGTIANTAVPTVSGTPTFSFTLTASGGSWTPGGTSSAFQWVRCEADGTGCTDLGGETATTYLIVLADVGKKVKVRETASKLAYADTSIDSALTGVISDADTTPPTNTITLGSPAGAFLAGTTLYYRPAAGGSFTLSSAVADSGFGPASAAYPTVTETGWTHGAETVSTPAGGPYVSSTFSWTPAASGTFPYVVTAADAWSPPNTSPTTLSVTKDSNGPASSVECNGAACSSGWYTSSPVSVTLSAVDAGAGADLIRYTTDGTDPTLFTGATYLAAISVAPEGTTTVKYRSYDRVGNAESVQTQLVRIDTVAPDTTIDSGPSGATSATDATFTFSSNDGAASFECRLLPGGSYGPCATPKNYSSLAEGSYTFEVRAVDAVGNTDASAAARTWTVDTTPADTTITSAPPAATNATGASFSFIASDAGPGFECKLDAGSFAACGAPHSYAGLAEGSYTFSVRAVDAAGNVDPTPATHTWTVDTTAPDTTIPLTPVDPSANTTPTFGFSSSQSPSTYECDLDGAGWNACPTPHNVSPALADGSHTLEARATDAAGNTDATPASFTWLVDATAPTGALTSPVDGSAVSGSVALAANSADAGGSGVMHALFEVSPAGAGSWTTIGAADTSAPYSVSLDTTTLTDGDYDLRVTTRDNAGNSTASPLLTVTVDNTDPTLSASAPNPVNLATADPATITATASDAGSGVASVAFEQCNETSIACDSDTWTSHADDTTVPYSASWPIPADGIRLLRVRATDGAGRQRTELILTTVDRTVPTGTMTAPAAAANLRGSADASASAGDPAPGGVGSVGFQITAEGAPYTAPAFASDNSGPSYDGTLDTTAHGDGLYDLRAFVNDVNGNSSASPRVTVRIDNTAPTGSVTAPVAGANVRGTVGLTSDSADPPVGGSASGVATVQFQRSLAGAGSWTNQTASWNTTLVADGQYDLRVVTTDNAGGSFTSSAVTVRVDSTAPTGSVTAPANGTEIGLLPVTLTSDSADPLSGGSASGVDTVVFERRPAGGGAWTATPTSWNTASGPDAVADGSYELRVTTTDLAGNSFAWSSITVLVDHTAPVTTASLSPGSPSNAPVTVTFSAADGTGSGVSQTAYRVDGGSVLLGGSVVISAPGSHANDGPHLVEFFSTDDVGNVEALKSVTVVIDTTAPNGSAGDPGSYLRGIAQLAYTTSDTDVSSVLFQFSPAGLSAWASIGPADATVPYEVTWNTALVVDGAYDLRAVVTDSAGNVQNTLLPGLPKYVDNTAPAGVLTSPAPSAFLSGSVDVTATGTDGAVPPASGVSAVRFELKPAGAGGFTAFGTETVPMAGSTYGRSLDTTAVGDGPAELRVIVTDGAGNETTSAARTVTIDNVAPTVTLADPGSAISGSPTLTATAAADTVSVTFELRPAAGGAWAAIGADATPGDGFTVGFPTVPLVDGLYELRARALDGGGNAGTSGSRTARVDNELPTGSITSPGASDILGGTSVALAATAADGGSGVATVEFTVKPQGSPSYSTIFTDSAAPYAATWDATAAPDGTALLRLVITDAAGNQRQSAVVPVTVDSTGPSVTLGDPGAIVSGAVALTTTTGGGAVRVVFGISPAGGTWTPVAEDTTAPFGANLDTLAFGDGLYDLRAIGYDAVGNPSAPAVRSGVRLDNTAPQLVSSTPADGSVSTSASQIVLNASEPVVVTGALLDGGPAPAPTSSGSTLTFATGSLADGLHVLSGRLEDASGTSRPFRVAVTIESMEPADRWPVEKSASSSQQTVVTAAGSLGTVSVPPTAWPQPALPEDFLVVRIDPSPALAAFSSSLAPGSQLIEVTAHWALSGTEVTQFAAPITITISNSGGTPVVPALSPDGTAWRSLPLLAGGTLSAGQPDGFYRDAGGVHIVTRHLTYFALLRDFEPPTPPRHVAGVVADDGLTLRWIPGSDNSGQLGHVVLFVNGESYERFDVTQFETKLGPFAADDAREFTFVQLDAAGNVSERTPPLRAVPSLAGLGLAQAAAVLTARGFAVGEVRDELAGGRVPGTVLRHAGNALAVEAAKIDLVVAAGTAPRTKLAFQVASAKRLVLARRLTVAARVKVTRPATLTATLHSLRGTRLHTWRRSVKAGSSIVRLPLPPRVRTGVYRLVWVARAGQETVRRSLRVEFVRPGQARRAPTTKAIEVVVAGRRPTKSSLRPALRPEHARVLAQVMPDETFSLAASELRDVRVVVVDVDEYGVGFLRDLRTVFPSLRLIAISSDPVTLARATRAGATLALLRSTDPKRLARAIMLGR